MPVTMPDRLIAAVWAAALSMLLAGCGDEPASSPAPTPGGAVVRSISTLTEDGGRLAWSGRLNRIAFDRLGADGYFDIWTMNPDGSAQACLTCNRPGIPSRHVGNPSWHPTGEFIVFQAQKEVLTGAVLDFIGNPGAGINNDMYVMDAAGQQPRRLVTVPLGFGGVLHPLFSSSGSELQWAERVSNTGLFGQWVIKVADFRVTAGVPSLDNIRTYSPGAQQAFYETHGFGPGDQDILFSGNLERGVSELGIDIYRFNPATGSLANLTASATEWDEHAHFSPSGSRIAWMSSRGYPPVSDPGALRTEFWLMNADGSGKTQLTRFNQAGQPESIAGQALAADLDWSPDGRRIAAYVMTTPAQNRGRIVMIELNAPGQSEDVTEDVAAPPAGEAGYVQELHASADDAELSEWEDLLADMAVAGTLVERSRERRSVSGREIARYTQYARGLPVFRGDVVAQFEGSRLVSVFGTLHPSCYPDSPLVTAADARETAARHAMLVGGEPLTLSAVPHANGVCLPTYVGRGVSAGGPIVVFVDARSGAFSHEALPGGLEIFRPEQTPRAASPLVTEVAGGRFFARDGSRTPGIVTLDLGGRIERTASAFRAIQPSDIASDADGAWDDEVVRAFHAEAAAAYDVVLSRFGRRGIAAGVPIVGMVHPGFGGPPAEGVGRGPFHAGAGLLLVPDGPQAMSGMTQRAVAHALAHAVIDHTSGLAPSGEPGAIRDAFTVMVDAGTPAENVAARALAIARSHLQPAGRIPADAIDRVFFSAVTELLPARATFAMAREATLQGARDLFGPASAVEAALRAGWSAAGVGGR
jgi:Tol biopolymer transport system component